jgi:hypothetical protein
MKLSIITLMFGIPYGLNSDICNGNSRLIITNIAARVPSMVIGLYWIRRRYKTKAYLKTSAKILFASTVAALTAFLIITFVASTDWVELVTGGVAFLLTYLIFSPSYWRDELKQYSEP